MKQIPPKQLVAADFDVLPLPVVAAAGSSALDDLQNCLGSLKVDAVVGLVADFDQGRGLQN